METMTLQEMLTLLGPSGSVVVLVVYMFIKDKRNGNSGVLKDIHSELKSMNKRQEDIWKKVNKGED